MDSIAERGDFIINRLWLLVKHDFVIHICQFDLSNI